MYFLYMPELEILTNEIMLLGRNTARTETMHLPQHGFWLSGFSRYLTLLEEHKNQCCDDVLNVTHWNMAS